VLLREPATLHTGGGFDSDGNPLPTTDTAIRAEFAPLTAEESFSAGRSPSSVTYRMIFTYPTVLPTATTVTWRAKEYDFVGPSMQHTIQGRLHHQEAIVTRATG
jgi:hypothetical protein